MSRRARDRWGAALIVVSLAAIVFGTGFELGRRDHVWDLHDNWTVNVVRQVSGETMVRLEAVRHLRAGRTEAAAEVLEHSLAVHEATLAVCQRQPCATDLPELAEQAREAIIAYRHSDREAQSK